ncbi:MAG: hypothetical protein LBN23_05255 [Paludibacter sp.]|jgi:hypothetical protein|nr:hypothetical protein [Paludibacter sp.]
MKKVLFFVAMFIMISAASVYSQDIITLKNGNEIQALVQEIGTEDVKYKKFDNPQGPNYTLKKSEIFIIRYANGDKDVFTEKENTDTDKGTPRKVENVQQDIEQVKNEFYRIGNDDREMLKFFAKQDPVYYKNFSAACRQRNTGSGLLYFGVLFQITGVVTMITAKDETGYMMGLLTGAVGEVLTLVSIPVSAGAGSKKKAIKNAFAAEYLSYSTSSYQPTVTFGATSNGIGLTLNF